MLKLIFATIIAAAVITGCSTSSQTFTPADTNQSATVPTPTPFQFTGSLLSLLNGTDKQCTWSGKVENYDLDGTIYASGNNFRAEVKTQRNILPVTGYAVGDGQTITAWANIAPDKKIIKSYSEITKTMQQTPSLNSQIDPLLEQFTHDQTYTCQLWTSDPSAFTIPQ